MKQTGLTASQLALVCDLFCRIGEIREVILYGSRAKGNYRPESDVDLALVGVADELRAEAIAEELESLPLPFRFDVRSYDGIVYALLLDHIKRVGISIYQRSP